MAQPPFIITKPTVSRAMTQIALEPISSIKELQRRIRSLAIQKNAIILSHYYQRPEIQDIADFVGDSLALARQAQKTKADIIILAGVYFMAETAKLLNPDKKVFIPDVNAGCSLVESCPPVPFKQFIEQYDNRFVMTYINSSIEIKAMSDIICTSSNALKLVQMVPPDKTLIFAPDRHLGEFLQRVTGREMVIWPGQCIVHEEFSADQIKELKKKYPDAKVIVHPECGSSLLEIADFVGSTGQLLKFVKEDSAKRYIVGTEEGIVHQMRKQAPGKEFIVVPPVVGCVACQQCPYMKLNTLEKIYNILLNEPAENEIIIPEDLAERARIPVERMLEWTDR